MSGICRKDKFARKSYEAIHNTKGEWTAHDITTVTDDDLRLLRGQVDVICGGFPAKPSVLPESDWDSQKLEELCSSKLLDSPKKSNHNIYSLKTSKAYSITTEGTHLEQSSPRLMNWGMMRNGKYLTVKISESHKIEKGCSLLDILEDQVDEKYFLSEEKHYRY